MLRVFSWRIISTVVGDYTYGGEYGFRENREGTKRV